MRNHGKQKWMLLAIFMFMLIVLITTPFIGSQDLKLGRIFSFFTDGDSVAGTIFFKIRLPRILLAMLTGASLSLAGVVFQALLRNPLATPYTLGVSSGGALGAVLMIKLGWDITFLGFSTIQSAAFIGSLLTILLVYYLARKAGRISIHTMILAGVTISYFFGAMILMLHFLADFTETRQMVRWMMGGLDIVEYSTLWRSLPVLLLSYFVLFYHSGMLNIISTSEETALSKGVNVARVQKIVFVTASLITGLVVAVSGPIGFVGLIVPHFLRMIIGVDHRYLIPASLLFGGAFLTICDTLARTVIAPIDVPVGIITAILGGPFFLWMLVRHG